MADVSELIIVAIQLVPKHWPFFFYISFDTVVFYSIYFPI